MKCNAMNLVIVFIFLAVIFLVHGEQTETLIMLLFVCPTVNSIKSKIDKRMKKCLSFDLFYAKLGHVLFVTESYMPLRLWLL